ncbi:MAG: sulfatase-like hydrolase/transferase, partial [Acidobacteria bacterium]|nr:sulfatase-like hydrolase/transferase [Acidobacteriota bacterium]MCI0721224.1 sulfatase-like hydrolase/transferase [Acidobacteriota bacterium]
MDNIREKTMKHCSFTHRNVVKAIAVWMAFAVPSLAAAAMKPRPNILFIMTDDHAAHAISAYGSRINQTPSIDRLARDGMRFDRCLVVNSVCAPSRAAILTGKYSHKNGVPVFNRFDGSQPHLARYLQSAGYTTGIVGKWHLGSEPTGFDHYTVLPGHGLYHDPAFLDGQGRRTIKGYVTDIITDLAIEFIKNRPKHKPFFLALHHKAPHSEMFPDAKHARLYEDVDIPEPPTLRDDYATRTDAAREATMTIARHLSRYDLKLEPPAELQGAERQQWLDGVPMEVSVEIQGKRQTLTGDALLRWKYQRYIKDYLR